MRRRRSAPRARTCPRCRPRRTARGARGRPARWPGRSRRPAGGGRDVPAVDDHLGQRDGTRDLAGEVDPAGPGHALPRIRVLPGVGQRGEPLRIGGAPVGSSCAPSAGGVSVIGPNSLRARGGEGRAPASPTARSTRRGAVSRTGSAGPVVHRSLRQHVGGALAGGGQIDHVVLTGATAQTHRPRIGFVAP